MKVKNATLIMCLSAWMLAAGAAELKAPQLRDEDLSATVVFMEVTRNAVGMYVYTYDVESPLTNTGRILQFVLDIACDDVVDPRGFDARDYPSAADRSLSEDGRHVPVVIDAPWGQAAAFRIGLGNHVHWSLRANPGTDSRGLTLISPYPPGARTYQVIPSIRYGEEQWDYSDVEEDDPEVPWLDDWIVTGITTGPACPGEEYPDGIPGETRFPGSTFAGETDRLNELLTYSAPLRDKFHVEAGVRELEMTLHYHADIDPKTFRVTPEKHDLRRLFNPVPGTSETVHLPLEPGKNRIELQVQAALEPLGEQAAAPRPVVGRGGVSMDRDVFVIRVDAEAGHPGKGPNQGRDDRSGQGPNTGQGGHPGKGPKGQ